MDKKPRASVILTSWNRPVLLEQAIRSILAQTEERWELWVADDNSSNPRVDEVLHDLLDDEPRGDWWKSNVNDEDRPKEVRFSVTINTTFDMTTGDIIFYCTDDNEYFPDCIKTVCDYFDEHPEIHAACVAQKIMNVNWQTGEDLEDRRADLMIRGEFEPLTVRASYRLDLSQVMHRRHVFNKTDKWPTDPHWWQMADGVFFDDIIKVGFPIYPIEPGVPLILYKISDSSLCRQPVEEALGKLSG